MTKFQSISLGVNGGRDSDLILITLGGLMTLQWVRERPILKKVKREVRTKKWPIVVTI